MECSVEDIPIHIKYHLRYIMRKQVFRPLSLSYQQKAWLAPTKPSLLACHRLLVLQNIYGQSGVIPKGGLAGLVPSKHYFGMTTTKIAGPILAWHSSHSNPYQISFGSMAALCIKHFISQGYYRRKWSHQYLRCVTRKQTLKVFVVVRRYGMTPTFREYNLWCQQSQILKSRCHTKRRMGAVFWYDNDKDLKVCFLVTRAIAEGNEAINISHWLHCRELL